VDVWRCEAQMVCVWEREGVLPSSYTSGKGRCRPYSREILHATVLGALNALPDWRWGWEAVLGVRAHPWCDRTWAGPSGHRLWRVGWWLGLGPSLGGLAPDVGLLFLPLRESALCFVYLRLLVYFPLYCCISPAKHCSSKYMWNYVNSKGICV
jgi:hypothetical protein